MVKEICKGFAAKDIQSRCRNLREMKDVFNELKVLPFEFRLADLVGVPGREECVGLVDYSAGVFLSRMCLPVGIHLENRSGSGTAVFTVR